MRNLLAASALSCAFIAGPAFAQDELTAETVLATVNGTEITLGHMILLREQLPEQYLTAPDDILFEGMLMQLIEQTLLVETVTEETLEMRLIIENERRALWAGAAIDDALSTPFTDEEFQAAYDAAFGDLPEDPEFNASHILVETEDEVKALIVELDGGADFAELAKENSTGPSGPNGGELGWFGLGMMVAPFEAAVLEMEVGQISPPVQTQFGWHVLILNEKRIKPAPTLDQVKPELAGTLRQERLDGVIDALRESAEIENMAEGIDPTSMHAVELLNP